MNTDIFTDYTSSFNRRNEPLSYRESLKQSNDQSLYIKLEKIWVNEKFSKDLLKYETQFMQELIYIIEKREEELKDLAQEINENTKKLEDLNLMELDLDRVKFLFKDYLRIRLMKIDKYLYYLVQYDPAGLLSEKEREFVMELRKIKINYFQQNFYNKISSSQNDFKNKDGNISDHVIVAPGENYVCAKSTTNEPILINFKDVLRESDEMETIKFKDIYCLPLSLIKDKLEENKMMLI
jgi:GINS complex subunit 4